METCREDGSHANGDRLVSVTTTTSMMNNNNHASNTEFNHNNSMMTTTTANRNIVDTTETTNANDIINNNSNNGSNTGSLYTYIILFYKYHSFINNNSIMEEYQTILYTLCTSLQLQGRILIGIGSDGNNNTGSCSTNNTGRTDSDISIPSKSLSSLSADASLSKPTHTIAQEGINGTLSGSYDDVLYFTYALLYSNRDELPKTTSNTTILEGGDRDQNNNSENCNNRNTDHDDDDDDTNYDIIQEQLQQRRLDAIELFWKQSSDFFTRIQLNELRMISPDDFKWSSVVSSSSSSSSLNDTNKSSSLLSLSNTDLTTKVFPDLYIKLVAELIGTGCKEFISIPISETSVGYLTPQEWHSQLSSLLNARPQHTNNKNSNNNDNQIDDDPDTPLIIDCRNTKEYAIGHFQNAIHPNTTTFSQFIPWVQQNKIVLESKKNIYMYCTGGIRCEKASAYIRRVVNGNNPNNNSNNRDGTSSTPTNVYHLKGGIHKYLEQYGATSSESNNNNSDDTVLWKGRNFVFDSRGAISSSTIVDAASAATIRRTTTTTKATDDRNMVVGQCLYCEQPYDQFDPDCVCTVCREPILICPRCQDNVRTRQNTIGNSAEYHCMNHYHLRECYYTNLERYTIHELQYQYEQLLYYIKDIAIGRKFKQKRKTLQKQISRIQVRIQELSNTSKSSLSITDKHIPQTRCRNCGSTECRDGRCWGFYGLKRKELLESDLLNHHSTKDNEQQTKRKIQQQLCYHQNKLSEHNKRKQKRRNNEAAIQEMTELHIIAPPSSHRDDITGIRVPPCCTRIVQCNMKAKWYGQTILKVIQTEFAELAKTDVLKEAVSYGLLRLNGKVLSIQDLTTIKLKGSDTLGRIVHWHEAPVLVPSIIDVQRFECPLSVLQAYDADIDDTGVIFICNKPSSVPTHPAGPYLSNTLTIMVEGQESLPPLSLFPLHRTDRVTSGLTLCTTSLALSRAFHKSLTDGHVDKMYLAKVEGKFPSSADDVRNLSNSLILDPGICEWYSAGEFVIVDAPVYTMDAAAGIRSVNILGKPSKSYFKHLHYDASSNSSVVLCCPVSGRNHQLRVHLQRVGYPIVHDVQYGASRYIRPSSQATEVTAIRAMKSTILRTSGGEFRVSSLTDQDVVSARKACTCCRDSMSDGIFRSFTKAQLLVEGHSICLHAYRYRIRIFPPKSTPTPILQDCDDDLKRPASHLVECDFQVRLPSWVDEHSIPNLTWLQVG